MPVIRQKGKSQNGCFKKTKRYKFSEKRAFVTPVSGGKKYSFFGKIDLLCFLETPVLRFVLLLYYRWIKTCSLIPKSHHENKYLPSNCISDALHLKLNQIISSFRKILKKRSTVLCNHGDIILNRNNNSVFLLRKSIEIGKTLISTAPRESEWSTKRLVTRLLSQNLKFNISKYLLGCSKP